MIEQDNERFHATIWTDAEEIVTPEGTGFLAQAACTTPEAAEHTAKLMEEMGFVATRGSTPEEARRNMRKQLGGKSFVSNWGSGSAWNKNKPANPENN